MFQIGELSFDQMLISALVTMTETKERYAAEWLKERAKAPSLFLVSIEDFNGMKARADKAEALVKSMEERIAAQSELLSKKAEQKEKEEERGRSDVRFSDL